MLASISVFTIIIIIAIMIIITSSYHISSISLSAEVASILGVGQRTAREGSRPPHTLLPPQAPVWFVTPLGT